eukprot:g1059.t1
MFSISSTSKYAVRASNNSDGRSDKLRDKALFENQLAKKFTNAHGNQGKSMHHVDSVNDITISQSLNSGEKLGDIDQYIASNRKIEKRTKTWETTRHNRAERHVSLVSIEGKDVPEGEGNVHFSNTAVTLLEGIGIEFYEVWIGSKPTADVIIEVQNTHGSDRIRVVPEVATITPENWKKHIYFRVECINNGFHDLHSQEVLYVNHSLQSSDKIYGMIDNLPLVRVAISENSGEFIYSWGSDAHGALGFGPKECQQYYPRQLEIPFPKDVPNNKNRIEQIRFQRRSKRIKCVASGSHHSVIVSCLGDAYSWGLASDGQTGHGKMSGPRMGWKTSLPKCIKAMSSINVEQVSCGSHHTILVTANHDVYAFGSNEYGQLGIGQQLGSFSSTPVMVEVISHTDKKERNTNINVASDEILVLAENGAKKFSASYVQNVACGYNHTMVVTFVNFTDKDGRPKRLTRVYSFGDGSGGQLGHGNRETLFIPKVIRSLTRHEVCSIACGSRFSAAITSNGQLMTWGFNGDGRLGYSTSDDGSKKNDGTQPRIVPRLRKKRIIFVACGGSHCACLTHLHIPYSWGCGSQGQLGHGTCYSVTTPMVIQALKTKRIQRFSLGEQHTLATTEDGLVYAFGFGAAGQLGNGGKEANPGEHDGNSSVLPRLLPTLYDQFSLQVGTGCSTSLILCNEPELAFTEHESDQTSARERRLKTENQEMDSRLEKITNRQRKKRLRMIRKAKQKRKSKIVQESTSPTVKTDNPKDKRCDVNSPTDASR